MLLLLLLLLLLDPPPVDVEDEDDDESLSPLLLLLLLLLLAVEFDHQGRRHPSAVLKNIYDFLRMIMILPDISRQKQRIPKIDEQISC